MSALKFNQWVYQISWGYWWWTYIAVDRTLRLFPWYVSKTHMRVKGKWLQFENWIRTLIRTKTCWCPNFRFLASSRVENIFLCLQATKSRYLVIEVVPNDEDISLFRKIWQMGITCLIFQSSFSRQCISSAPYITRSLLQSTVHRPEALISSGSLLKCRISAPFPHPTLCPLS